jgi:antitoxin (DNA-binding transcriptional repressor) of toxin-antitoxin stability system
MRKARALGGHARAGAVVIEKRGKPVAEMRPVKRVTPREAARKLKALWDSLPQVNADSGRFLEEDR